MRDQIRSFSETWIKEAKQNSKFQSFPAEVAASDNSLDLFKRAKDYKAREQNNEALFCLFKIVLLPENPSASLSVACHKIADIFKEQNDDENFYNWVKCCLWIDESLLRSYANLVIKKEIDIRNEINSLVQDLEEPEFRNLKEVRCEVIGDFYFALKDLQSALDYYLKSLNTKKIAKAFFELGRTKDAEDSVRGQYDPESFVYIGQLFFEIGNNEKATEYFELSKVKGAKVSQFKDLGASLGDEMSLIAQAISAINFHTEEKYRDSLAALEKLKGTLSNQFFENLVTQHQAICWINLKNYKKGLKYLLEGIENGFPPSLNLLARSVIDGTFEFGMSLDELEKLFKGQFTTSDGTDYKNSTEYLLNLGKIYLANGKKKEGIRALDECLTSEGEDYSSKAEAAYRLYVEYLENNENKKSSKYEKVCKKYGGFEKLTPFDTSGAEVPQGLDRIKVRDLGIKHHSSVYAGGAAAYAFEFGAKSWFDFNFGFDCTFGIETLHNKSNKDETIGFIITPEDWTKSSLNSEQEIPIELLIGLDRTYSLGSTIQTDTEFELYNLDSLVIFEKICFTTGGITESSEFEDYLIDAEIELTGEFIAFNFDVDKESLDDEEIEDNLYLWNPYPFMVIRKEFFE